MTVGIYGDKLVEHGQGLNSEKAKPILNVVQHAEPKVTEAFEEKVEKPKTAAEVVAEIEVADTVEAVNALADGDERKTVIAAAEKKIAELSA